MSSVCARMGMLVFVAGAVLAGGATAYGQTATSQVTFTKDVAPILQRSCQTCHRPGEMAPMSLVTYEDVRPWARAIKQRTTNYEMPPFHIDRTIGIQEFKDNPSLSDEEIATLAKWVDAGAPRGNPADMPPARVFAEGSGWQIKPDVIVKFPAKLVPAAGPDLFGNLYADIPIDSDRYIKAIQSRSGNAASRKVVHHALTFAVDDPAAQDVNGDDSTGVDGGQFLVEYASGKNAEVYPPETGVLIQAGKKAMVSYHLHSIGEETQALIEVGIELYPKGYVPKHIRWSQQLSQSTTEFDIPAGAIARIDGYTVLHKAARIIAFQPHMHIRGKRQCLELIYPTSGSSASTEMVNCANFNYNWHLTYNYTDDSAPLVPAGTILHVISYHDNSASNKYNPDPKNWVGGGQRTIDEMGFAWIGWYDMTDEEYKAAVAERNEKRQRTTQQQQQQQQQ